jgi:hypothetical protein
MFKTSKIVEKRKFPRFPLSIKSRAHVRNEVGSRVLTFACEVVNVSEGGLMLTAREPFMAVGQTVVVEIDFEGGLELHGRVCGVAPVEVELSEDNLEKSIIRWIDKKNGKFGVEFVELDSKRREKLTALISRLRGASLKSSED